MEKLSAQNLIRLEILWITLTLLLCALVLLPLALNIAAYPFWVTNILFILTFVTATRHIFLLRFTFLAHAFWPKMVIIFLTIPFVFYLIQELNGFQTFLDEEGPEAVVGLHALDKLQSLIQYVRNEMLLFGVGAIIAAVILPFRLMLSIWRIRNGKERV